MKRPGLVLIGSVVAMLGVAGPALATWSATGQGSAQATATSLVAPSALGTSAGSPADKAINVTFTPGSNPAGTTYTVTRDKKKDGTTGPEVACSGLTASPCADIGLTASTTYTYTVKAVLGGWSAQAVGSVNRTTAAETAPPAPATVTVASPCAQYTKAPASVTVNISWSASTGATSYRLSHGTDSTTAPTTASQTGIAGTSTTLTYTPANRTAYYFWVEAVNATGASAKTKAGQRVTTDASGATGSCTVDAA